MRERNDCREKNKATSPNQKKCVKDINIPYSNCTDRGVVGCTTCVYVLTTNKVVLGFNALVRNPLLIIFSGDASLPVLISIVNLDLFENVFHPITIKYKAPAIFMKVNKVGECAMINATPNIV